MLVIHLKLGTLLADETGAFAFGIQNKSLANTTITAVGYYGKDFALMTLVAYYTNWFYLDGRCSKCNTSVAW